jgi:hypothetical protein
MNRPELKKSESCKQFTENEHTRWRMKEVGRVPTFDQSERIILDESSKQKEITQCKQAFIFDFNLSENRNV